MINTKFTEETKKLILTTALQQNKSFDEVAQEAILIGLAKMKANAVTGDSHLQKDLLE